MKVLVTGGNGQLGLSLKNNQLLKNNSNCIFTDRKSFDISDLDNIKIYLDKYKPDIIVNCAALTSVEAVENFFELANVVNHKAICLIAEWCDDNNCKLLHISTDYVYDGYLSIPYAETDKTNPLNNYGKTKLLGDIACQKKNPSSIIIRTSWLYSIFGNNFLSKMINIMQNSNEIEVIDDQFGSPTYAADLANVISYIIINNKWHPGVYHYTNLGKVSWFDFANKIKIIYGFNTIIKPISSKDYPTNVKRPTYSLLDNSKIINTFKINQIDYLNSLNKCIKIIKNES